MWRNQRDDDNPKQSEESRAARLRILRELNIISPVEMFATAVLLQVEFDREDILFVVFCPDDVRLAGGK